MTQRRNRGRHAPSKGAFQNPPREAGRNARKLARFADAQRDALTEISEALSFDRYEVQS